MKTLLSFAVAFFLFGFNGVQTDTSTFIDYHIYFSGKGAEGTFSELQGLVRFDPNDLPASTMDVTVQVNTISTGTKGKDKHAKGDSWFDAVLYPTIRFQSDSFTSKGQGQYLANGVLAMHGIEKNVSIPFIHQKLESSSVFEGSFTVNRQDFGIEGPFMAFTVGDEFEVQLRVEVAE